MRQFHFLHFMCFVSMRALSSFAFFTTRIRTITKSDVQLSLESGADDITPSDNQDLSLWFKSEQLETLSRMLNMPIDDIVSNHVDVTYEYKHYEDIDTFGSIFRIRPRSKIFKAKYEISDCKPLAIDKICNIEKASQFTYSWCSNFVKHLNLCPWAKQSLSCENAIRIKIVDQSDGLESMEYIVKDSAIELKELSDRGIVDPLIGITFVVFLPTSCESGKDDKDFNFLSFYDKFNELEEKFLEELVDQNGNYIGDEVTIAPFHPNWSFSSSEEKLYQIVQVTNDAINYEKRTPFPTISIVMSKGIDLAGEEATEKIGMHNEKVLNEIGSRALKKLYHENVFKSKVY